MQQVCYAKKRRGWIPPIESLRVNTSNSRLIHGKTVMQISKSAQYESN